MTNTQLEAFLTLCRYGNITQAAEHLFITQPALSRLIKSLESELGYTLFRRGKGQRQAVLTEEGQRFRAIAVDMNRLYRQAKSQETTKVKIHAAYLRNTRPILLFSAGRIYPFSQGPTGCGCGIRCRTLHGGISATCPRAG